MYSGFGLLGSMPRSSPMKAMYVIAKRSVSILDSRFS
jgi:hypothetical protein